MAENPEGTQQVDVEAQKKDLLAKMQEAMNSGDFKAVSKISSEIAKLAKSQEDAERKAKEEALKSVTAKVKAAIDKVVQKLKDDKVLDEADGVWYSDDFGEKMTTCRLTKAAPRAKGTGGGGGGKKFSVSTKELLEQYGSTIIDEESGQTCQQLWDSSTDGNTRYRVRVKLLKVAGISGS